MEENIEATPGNAGITMTSAEPRSSGQLLGKDTLNRTCTQKLSIPTLEKQDQANANMWWAHKDDQGDRLFNHDAQQGNTNTVP